MVRSALPRAEQAFWAGRSASKSTSSRYGRIGAACASVDAQQRHPGVCGPT